MPLLAEDTMNILRLCVLFPLVLAVHNADEFRQYEEFVRVYHGRLAKRFVTKPVVQTAAILLTCAGVLLGVLTAVYRTPVLVDASFVASLALMLNACSHVVVSLKARTLTPGTLSALLIVLPYGALLLYVARLPWEAVLRFAALGLFVAPAAVVLFLFLGYSVTLLSHPNNA